MVADSSSHTPATFQENSGFRINGFPVLGAWLSYGMGCETDELPAYVVLPDVRGLPADTTNVDQRFLHRRGVRASPFAQARQSAICFRRGRSESNHRPGLARIIVQLQSRALRRRDADDALSIAFVLIQLAAKMQLADTGHRPGRRDRASTRKCTAWTTRA